MNDAALILAALAFVNSMAHAGGATNSVSGAPVSSDDITIRTESYPRPPYSGATCYFYEKGNQTMCTKRNPQSSCWLGTLRTFGEIRAIVPNGA